MIADYAPYTPWIEELLGAFISFSPIVSQNPTLVHIVSVRLELTLSLSSDGQGGSRAARFYSRFAP